MRSYLSAILFVIAISSFIIFLAYEREYYFQTQHYNDQLRDKTNDIALTLKEQLSTLTSDLLFIRSEIETESHEETLHIGHMQSAIVSFMRHKPIYDQIRILDLEGNEQFRINQNGGNPLILEPNNLQNKATRYYFKETLALNSNEIYLSRVDLNMENGKIEQPLKLTMRIATPIFDKEGKKSVIVVFNVLFESLFKTTEILSSHPLFDIYLANSDGQWLIAPKGQRVCVFMYGDRSNQVKTDYKNLWDSMQKNRLNIVENEKSLISYDLIIPIRFIQKVKSKQSIKLKSTLEDKKLQWWVIAHMDKELIAQMAWINVKKGFPYLVMGLIALLLLSIFSIKLFKEKIKNQKKLYLSSKFFENSSDGLVITDAHNKILQINQRYSEITGFSELDLMGKNPSVLSSGLTPKSVYKNMWQELEKYHYWEGELFDRRKNGEAYTQWLRVIVIRDKQGKIQNYLGITSDITQRKLYQQRIQKLAFEDTLTKLPNKNRFHECLKEVIAKAPQKKHFVALIFIDIDDFKIINNTEGHLLGDRLIIAAAKRLKSVLGVDDFFARLGGDEFIVIIEGEEKRSVATKAELLRASMQEAIVLDGIEHFLSVSIGVAIYPEDATSEQELITHVDTAMYKAKERGKNRIAYYQNKMHDELKRRLDIEKNMNKALQDGEFHLLFQPQISLIEKKVVGAEALIRWNSKALGFVSPGEFIPLAEVTGLIVPITIWVMHQVCQNIKQLDSVGMNTTIAVNISSVHLKEQDFVEQIESIVTEHNIAPDRIELEITEGALINNIEDTVMKLKKLHALGFKIAIDDFGTGYSSLSYLKKFNFDKLKIDQAFVKNLPNDKEDVGITKAIIAISTALNMQLIAEGVETQENLKFLCEEECNLIQGYFFSKPITLEEYIRYTKEFILPKRE